jgi:hypothetical protein
MKNTSDKTLDKERVTVLLDGSNFYHRLKDPEIGFKQILKFDYKKFAEWLAQKRPITECIYYVGLIKKEKGNKKVNAW